MTVNVLESAKKKTLSTKFLRLLESASCGDRELQKLCTFALASFFYITA